MASGPDILDMGARGATWTNGEPERRGDLVIPAIGIRPEQDSAPFDEGGLVKEAHGDLAREVDESLLLIGLGSAPLLQDALIGGDQLVETERVLNPDAAMAVMSFGLAEQGFGRGIMKIDGVVVPHIELDQAERIFGAGSLDDAAVPIFHIVARHIGRALRLDL